MCIFFRKRAKDAKTRMNRLAEQGMNQQYIEKRKRNMRAMGLFSCEPRNFHVFPLDNSDIQKPSVNQRSIPFQNYHRIEKPAKCMMEKLTQRDSYSKLCC